MYHTQLGRFISRDPLGFVDGMNLDGAYFVPGAMGMHQIFSGCYQPYLSGGGREKNEMDQDHVFISYVSKQAASPENSPPDRRNFFRYVLKTIAAFMGIGR